MSRRGHSLARQLGPPVLPAKFPFPRLAMGTERREGVAGARELLAAGDQRRRWPRSPKPGKRGFQRLESLPEGRGTAAAREEARGPRPVLRPRAPPPGAAGNRDYLGSLALSAALAVRGSRTN